MRPPAILYAFYLLAGLVLASLPHGLRPAENLVVRLVVPPAAAGTEAGRQSRSLIDLIRSIRTLHQQNEDLKAENQRLNAKLAQLQNVAHDNELLRSELGFAAQTGDQLARIPATVVGRSPSTFLQFVTINQGSQAGVAVGQAVVSQGYLAGRISEVTATTATVTLVTASRSLVPIILTQSRATGLLKGGLAGLTGEDLPADVAVVPGEGVTTSPLGEIIPGGVPVGTVTRRISADSDIIARIEIHSPVEFSKLETVFVLHPRS